MELRELDAVVVKVLLLLQTVKLQHQVPDESLRTRRPRGGGA